MKTKNTAVTVSKNTKNTKHTTIIFMLLALSILFLGSCSKNDDNDNDNLPVEIRDGLEFKAEIIENRNEAKQTTIINGNANSEVYGAEGTILYFPANSFVDQNGNPVTGSVSIELVEIYDKAKMLLTKMPTNGKRPNGDVETLVSGGEFYINATQEGEQLELANAFQIIAPAETFDNEMVLFNGQDNDCDDEFGCDIVWEEEEEGDLEPIQREGPNGGVVNGYGGFISNFGWTNIDRWYNDPRPKTMLQVDVPEGYDNTNCNIYISYDGEPTALALLDIYNPETELFSEHYGLIPIGLEVHVIFVSVQDSEYVYAIQEVVIEEDHLEIIETTNTATESELVDLINDLP